MKVDIIQTSFTGGEFAASLFGRTDIAQYSNAAALVENFLIRPYGPIISTPGTEFIAICKTGGSTGVVRVIDFTFGRTDAFIIEMGVGYFRFFANGAAVISSGTTVFELSHTYTATEINDIQFAQLNDIILLLHPSHAPAKLTRLVANNWTLTAFPFTGGPYTKLNVIYSGGTTTILSSATITVSGTAGSVTLSATANLFIASSSATILNHVNTFWKIGDLRTSPTTGLDIQGYVKITAITNPSTATATIIQTLSAISATTTWAQGSWSDVLGWPARVTFHQSRSIFARTAFQPQNVWGSKNFVLEDFAVNGGDDDDALDLPLNSNESNDIKWVASADGLIVGTYGGDFIIDSGDGSPLTPANTRVKKQTGWGSEAIQPKRIGNFLYYIQRFGQKIRELFFIWDVNGYKSLDKTILSPQMAGGQNRVLTTTNTGFLQMAYQQNPDTILWAVCSNGTLATLTREVDQEVQGWTRQTTEDGAGFYESIACIPSQEGPHDEVWVVVRRLVNGSYRRYIERFKSQLVPERQDQCFYLHCGLTYDAYAATAADTSSSLSISALSTVGATVILTCSASRFSSDDVGQRIRAIDASGVTLGEVRITGYTSGTIVIGEVKMVFDSLTYAAGRWGISVTSISGLDHLETKTVAVLADGGVDKPTKVVSAGSITLAYDYFIVNTGLPYTQKLQTLPKEAGSQRGTSQGKIQRINEVGFKLNRSFKGFKVGGDEDKLTKIQFRDPNTLMGTPEALFTGIIPNISFNGDLVYGAQVLLHNEEPLPIELLAMIISVTTEDK